MSCILQTAQCEDSSNFQNSLSDEQKQPGNELAETIHISFDYAQTALVSHSPQQVGPVYFKTPRKCHLFGICAESVPQKVSHLELTSKGANEIICSLNHYFDYENAIGYKNLNLH